MLRSKILMAFLVTFLTGCVSTTYTSLTPESYETAMENPEVHFSTPDRPFQLIGLLQADGAVGISYTQLIDSLKSKAKMNGADAIYVIAMQNVNTPQGLIYNPYLGGYQTIGGFDKPRAFAFALKYKEGSSTETKEIAGRWAGHGVSSVTGKFSFGATINASKGGLSGVLIASTGLTGSLTGFVEDNSVELLVIPSNPNEYCLLKFVGSYDGEHTITGQYSSYLCSVSEGGVIEMTKSQGE
jgi:hypothetical protein